MSFGGGGSRLRAGDVVWVWGMSFGCGGHRLWAVGIFSTNLAIADGFGYLSRDFTMHVISHQRQILGQLN